MAEAGGRLSDAELQTLLEGIDTAFEQVVHGRFGGGIEVPCW